MNDYQQALRDEIFRRDQGTPIFEIAQRVEAIVREQIAQKIEQMIDADVWASAYTTAADIARGK